MSEVLPFGITDEDIASFRARQKERSIDNHPLRDVDNVSFFGALMSDEADFIKHGFVSKDSISILGVDEGE